MKGSDLLSIFPDFTVIAGHKGLDKNISTITVMDAPDIYNWMKGDEFLITSGYAFKDNPEKFSQLILNLKAKNITALGIKVSRFITKLPKIVIDTSNEVNLPIINIPNHYSFSDIINPGLTKLINIQYNQLVMGEKIHNNFIKMGIYNTDICSVLERLKEFIKTDVGYIDVKENKTYFLNENSLELLLVDNNIKDICNDNMYLHPVLYDERLWGYLIINSNILDLKPLDLRTIEYAQTMIQFHIQKEFSNKQIIKNYKDNLISDILLNNIKSDEEITNRAKIHNWELGHNMFCVFFDIDNYKLNYTNDNYQLSMEKTRDLVFKDIAKEMKLISKNSYYTSKSDSIVYIVNYEEDLFSFEESLLKICKLVEDKHNYTLTISIGNRYENIRDIHRSYEECLICLKNGKNFMGVNNSIIKYSDISIYWHLLNYLKEHGYENDPTISKLIELRKSDKLNNTAYYDSIKSIVHCDWNLKEASEKMYIHYNTIKYRYSRIKELLDSNLDSRAIKLKLELGIYMIEALEG